MVSIHVEATPTIGLLMASSSKPMAWKYERAAARCGPSVSVRDLCLTSNSVAVLTGAEPSGGRVASGLRAAGRAAILRQRARSHSERAPEIATDLLGIDLPPWEVHVRRGDEATLVARQCHPLGQHVVGVREARGAVRPRLVGELDAVLAEQLAGLREEGDDRLVRVDEVGVRRAPSVRSVPPCCGPSALRPQIRTNPRSRYIAHSSSFTHDLSSWRARCSARRSRPGSKPTPST